MPSAARAGAVLCVQASKSEQAMSWLQLLDPLVTILVSILLGLVGGYMLGAMRQPHLAAYNPLHRLLPGGFRTRRVGAERLSAANQRMQRAPRAPQRERLAGHGTGQHCMTAARPHALMSP